MPEFKVAAVGCGFVAQKRHIPDKEINISLFASGFKVESIRGCMIASLVTVGEKTSEHCFDR